MSCGRIKTAYGRSLQPFRLRTVAVASVLCDARTLQPLVPGPGRLPGLRSLSPARRQGMSISNVKHCLPFAPCWAFKVAVCDFDFPLGFQIVKHVLHLPLAGLKS